MTRLTLWDDLPQSTNQHITEQIITCDNTYIYDLGDVVAYLKENMPQQEFDTMWAGIEMLMAVITEKYNTTSIEAKMVVSQVKK